MNKILHIIFILLALSFNCHAQIGFETIAIEQLYNRLPESVRSEIYNSSTKNENKKIDAQIDLDGNVVSYSIENQLLKHVGIELKYLSSESKFEKTIVKFLERALLRLSLEKSLNDLIYTAEEMQIKILIQENELRFSTISGLLDLMHVINTSNQFILSQTGVSFNVEWNSSIGTIRMIFPNNYQLITGKNKKELDEEILKNLAEISMETASIIPSFDSKLANDSLPICIAKGSDYLNRLSSDVYYKFNKKDSILVFDKKFISYSVSNLFQKKQLSGNRTLSLNQKLYGKRSVTLNLYLQKYISFFESDYETFCGLESQNQKNIKGTVIIRHKYFNFIHLLYFDSNSTEIFSDEGKINADFYPNIPMHNVNNLFFQNLKYTNQTIINVKLK